MGLGWVGWVEGASWVQGREGRVEGLTMKIDALLGARVCVCVCVWFCGWAHVTFSFSHSHSLSCETKEVLTGVCVHIYTL